MENKTQNNIVDFGEFRKKKEFEDKVAKGRTPLFISHLDGKVKGSPHLSSPQPEDFGDRMQRIRLSLEKINQLMNELKKNSREKGESKR